MKSFYKHTNQPNNYDFQETINANDQQASLPFSYIHL